MRERRTPERMNEEMRRRRDEKGERVEKGKGTTRALLTHNRKYESFLKRGRRQRSWQVHTPVLSETPLSSLFSLLSSLFSLLLSSSLPLSSSLFLSSSLPLFLSKFSLPLFLSSWSYFPALVSSL